MQFFKYLIFYSISFCISAGEGIVTVLEAPLLIAPSKDATIVQYVRKGDKIFIGDEHFEDDEIPIAADKDNPIIENIYSRFYKSIDRNGNLVYIPQDYVKLIFKDPREFVKPATPFTNDPTDYRIAEPLGKNYPFKEEDHFRLIGIAGIGAPKKFNYNYVDESISSEYGIQPNFSFMLLKSITLDFSKRYFFGLKGRASYSQTNFLFEDELADSTENKFEVALTPVFTFDSFKNNFTILTLYGGPTVTYQQVEVKLDGEDLAEDRRFAGLSYGFTVGSYITLTNPREKQFSFILGAEANTTLPFVLESASTGEGIGWSEVDDNVVSGLDSSFFIYFGLLLSTI